MKSINTIYPETAIHISALSPSPVFAQKEHNPQKTEPAACRDAFPNISHAQWNRPTFQKVTLIL